MNSFLVLSLSLNRRKYPHPVNPVNEHVIIFFFLTLTECHGRSDSSGQSRPRACQSRSCSKSKSPHSGPSPCSHADDASSLHAHDASKRWANASRPRWTGDGPRDIRSTQDGCSVHGSYGHPHGNDACYNCTCLIMMHGC